MNEQPPAQPTDEAPREPISFARRAIAAAASVMVSPGFGHLILGRMYGFLILLLGWTLVASLPWLGLLGFGLLLALWVGTSAELLRPRLQPAVPPIVIAFATFFGLSANFMIGQRVAPIRLPVGDDSGLPALVQGEHLVASHATFFTGERKPSTGDLVVVLDRSGEQPVAYVRRVIAMGGELIGTKDRQEVGSCEGLGVKDESCRVFEERIGDADVRVLERSARAAGDLSCEAPLEAVSEGCRVPEDNVYLLPDNRLHEDRSERSVVRVEDVVGYPRFVFWSPGRFNRAGTWLDR